MEKTRRTFLWIATALLLIASMALPWTAFAYVTTDKLDYSPGEVVTISGDNRDGAGYLADEVVRVDVWGPNGYRASCDATTGDDGAWWCQVTLWPNALAVGEYAYTATGQTSGVLQSGTFTDAIGLKILGSDDNQHQNSASSENLGSVAQGTSLALTCPRGTGISVQGTGLGSGGTIAWSLAYVTTYGQSTTLQPLTTLDPSSGTQTQSSDKQCVKVTIVTSSLVVGTTYYGQLRASETDEEGEVTADYFFHFTVTGAANTTPTVTAPADQTAYEGTSKSFSPGSFTDPDGGPWTVDVDWGDGSTHTTFSMTAAGTITAQPHTYDDNGEYTVTVTVADSFNLSDSETFKITVSNVAPSATFAAASPIDEGSSSTVSFSSPSDPSTADTTAGFHYAYSCTNGDLSGATYLGSGASASTSCTFDDNGTFTVKGRIIDKDDGYTEYTASVTVNNVAPTVEAGDGAEINEGDTFIGSGSFSDPGADTWTATVDYGDGSGVQELTLIDKTFALSHTYLDDDADDLYTVQVCVEDDDEGEGCDTVDVTVHNVAPVVSIISPAEDYSVFFITSGVALSYGWTDPGTLDTFVCAVDWDDGTVPTSGSCTSPQTTGSHLYAGAGVYDITVTVTDDDGGVGTAMVTVVVVDPSAGFVTGGGWINSPAGAYKADETLSGRANFGFVSKYQKGATVPTGQTEFQFKAGGLNFHSASYQWLVVNQAGTNAQYKGVGTINGAGTYSFMLWATDGSTDTFRIKIWEGEDTVIYDNGFDQAIDGGSIVIHTGKK